MGLTKEHIDKALRLIRPDGRENIVDAGAVRSVSVCDGFVRVGLALPEGCDRKWLTDAVRDFVGQAAEATGEQLNQVIVEFPDAPAPRTPEAPSTSNDLLPGVSHVIAVGAGKGGVGKSTVSVNLAVGLARRGCAVGLIDGDIYGPSVPTLLGLEHDDTAIHGNMLRPFLAHGVKTMTMGKLVEADKPLIWRGPMAHGAFKQLVERTSWGELDYMIIDLPPGTGDVPLSMAQMLSLTGAVIVCTPQKVAQDDAVRAARMFQQLNVSVLGVIENMSFFIGDDGKEYDLFGRGGAESMAAKMGLPFLGAIPINMKLRENSDTGEPVRNFTDAGDALRDSLEHVVEQTVDRVAMASVGAGAPTLRVS